MKFNVYRAVYKAYIHPSKILNLDFDEIVAELKKHQTLLHDKEDGCLFNVNSYIKDFEHPAEYGRKDPTVKIDYSPYQHNELIRRCKKNVDTIYCLLIDVDSVMTIEEAVHEWAPYEFFMYSTHSHSAEKDKFRVVVPLKTPMSSLEFDSRHSAMCKRFKVDIASFTISQCFYYPSYSAQNQDIAFMYHNKTDNRFDALTLQAKVIVPRQNFEPVPPPASITARGLELYSKLLTGNNLHVPDAMPLAVLCKTHGIDFNGFKNIVMATGQGSQVTSKATDLKDLYTKAYSNGMRKKTEIELMQRIGCR